MIIMFKISLTFDYLYDNFSKFIKSFKLIGEHQILSLDMNNYGDIQLKKKLECRK